MLTERLALNHEDRAAVTRDQLLREMRTMYESALSSVKKFVLDKGQRKNSPVLSVMPGVIPYMNIGRSG